MSIDLGGKVAIVTGAGRARGMGRASALKLVERGAHVVVTDITPTLSDRANLESVGQEVENHGVKALAISVEMSP